MQTPCHKIQSWPGSHIVESCAERCLERERWAGTKSANAPVFGPHAEEQTPRVLGKTGVSNECKWHPGFRSVWTQVIMTKCVPSQRTNVTRHDMCLVSWM